MYQDYFGFSEMPFHITPNPRFLFLSPTHEEALQHLRYGIEDKKGFIVLTGEVGCGKTTLCRKLLEELEANEMCDTALLLNPSISETQLLKGIMKELGEESKARSKNDLLDKMNDVLLERIDQGREIVLIIDEAQNLSFEVMEMLRMLSNLETYDQKLLQIILIGQPELTLKLKEDRLRSPAAQRRRGAALHPSSPQPRRQQRPTTIHPACDQKNCQRQPRHPTHDQ
jgi:general secretion pathway protein A